MMEFHIARTARERYGFAESLFSYTGNVVFANMAACRQFAYRMNEVRDAQNYPDRAVHAGALYAMGLIDEASHVLMARYREQFDPEVMTKAVAWFRGLVGTKELDRLLLTFVEQFPGVTVMRGLETPRQWLNKSTEGVPHREAALEELLLLWSANGNQAFQPFEELFEDKTLAEKTVYKQVTAQLPEYFATRPLIPMEDAEVSLLDLLRAPAVDSPGSLSEQLDLIRKLWSPLLGEELERFLEVAGQILEEEELAIWRQFNPPDPAAQAAATASASARARAAAERRRLSGTQQWPSSTSHADVPVFGMGNPADEYEKFSPDTAWMPTTVLIAKSTYVWLAQLSRQYGRHIHRLDQIPDEELATLAARGLDSLWLIGVWERSRASKTIKQLCGNQDAVASAYSLFDYTIAEDLGGEGAYINLRDRCYRQGLRLASDMVPNHMGIDSPWVVEHPEWFISRQDKPYPVYSFEGPDLSSDGRVEIKIDDHYYEQTDAAVVFQRRDRHSGETRYIYHGNDGTSFPWNDTAQLDYLNPAVREQVIQTILHVARLFPVIRFDAAMTLARQHVQRLWFPAPGDTGSIPSRAEYGMSRAEFSRHMPHEFWREVVDRVAQEVPGTLLLAEAFWMLEGYFVRTLGMHRVYNSAFMVMLRDEDNAKYRMAIKTTLEFDPDIMKRYVNFMSNPDERTAIDQFGTGDKCFGVAAMMSTLPGLPMFGHGQIEGFTEKYGMEYQRPRYDERPDARLVERHDREIAPLLKRRWLFAESTNFLLYDFFQDSGIVDENVFAYSNRSGIERALVIFNNRYGNTHGTVDYSAAYADKGAGGLRQRRLREGLGLTGDESVILSFRDSLTGLEYLRRGGQVVNHGLTLSLNGYQCHVFLDWRELRATARQPWDVLCDQLNGAGVASLDDALVNLELRPVHQALRLELDSGIVRLLADLAEHPRPAFLGADKKEKIQDKKIAEERKELFELAWRRCDEFVRAAQVVHVARKSSEGLYTETRPTDPGLLAPVFRARLNAAMRIPVIEAAFPQPWTAAARRVLPSPSPQFTATAMWGPLLAWAVLELLAESIDAEKPERMALELFDGLRLREPLGQALGALGFEGEEAWRVAARIKVMLLSEAGVGRDEARVVEISPTAAAKTTVSAAKTAVGAAGLGGSERDELRADRAKASPARGPVAGTIAKGTEGGREAVGMESIALAPSLWLDPDVRWLTGVHEADGHSYLVRERYEELLWWLLLPHLLRVAAEPVLDRKAIARMGELVDEALSEAARAGYRIDALLKPAVGEAIDGDEGLPDPELEKLASEPELPEGDPVEAEAEAGPTSASVSPMDVFEPSTGRG
jgi:glycosidase